MSKQSSSPTTLVAPEPIASCLTAFDQLQRGFTELDVNGALQALEPKDMTPADKRGGWAEQLAFGLIPSSADNSPWSTYFGPIGCFENHEGKTFHRPDVMSADPGTLDYWANRARSVSHPILLARYADLVWEMAPTLGVKRRNADMARVAVDLS
jgi:hypothetical protein